MTEELTPKEQVAFYRGLAQRHSERLQRLIRATDDVNDRAEKLAFHRRSRDAAEKNMERVILAQKCEATFNTEGTWRCSLGADMMIGGKFYCEFCGEMDNESRPEARR